MTARLDELRQRAAAQGDDHYTRKLRELARKELERLEASCAAAPAALAPATTPAPSPPQVPSPAPAPVTPSTSPSTTTEPTITPRRMAVLRAIAAGTTRIADIATLLGTSRPTVSEAVRHLMWNGYLRPYERRCGVPAPPQRLTPEGRALVKAKGER